MRISLISTKHELYLLCRDLFSELPIEDWTLTQVAVFDHANAADLHIWDYRPETQFPDGLNGHPLKHLFLVHRAHLKRFRENIFAVDASIVLQPVVRATLASYLALAVSAKRQDGTGEQLPRADRDEVLECLVQANLRLQEHDQDRTEFLARTVHDFRAPLTALSGYCSLLLSEPLGELNVDQKEVVRRMQHSATRLSRMANAMFELSIAGHVDRAPRLNSADIRSCIDQATHEIMLFAESKQISISVDLAGGSDALRFEPVQIEQVLINLLDNACKFTHRQGEIAIRGYPYFWERREPRGKVVFSKDQRRGVSRQPNSYRVDILDNGTLIPKEDLKGIFEEYTSFGGSRNRLGAGLGLAICNMILRQHDGAIWAENTEAGPLFAFVLPFHATELDVKFA